MKVAFLGSGSFALPVLEALHAASSRHPLVAVVTRPDRPARRGRRPTPTPVRVRSEALGIAARTPASINDPAALAELRNARPELAVVADYGEILREPFLELPSRGAVNLHASILPRHRGASPVAHAILAGDSTSGVTLFRLERGLDSGPVIARREVAIGPDETAGELEARLAGVAGELTGDWLDRLARGDFTEEPQDPAAATRAPKLEKETGRIDWRRTPEEIRNFARALWPWPTAFSFLIRSGREPERTIFSRLEAAPGGGDAAPGTVVAVDGESFSVACSGGRVRVLEVQREGKARLSAAEYLRGRRLEPGDRFTSEPEG